MESSENKSISELGRQGLIKKLERHPGWRSENVIKGMGDDTAVFNKNKSTYTLSSSETFIEGVEFDLSYMPFHQLGAKVISAAVSDIYAMNGKPYAVLVNLGLPNRINIDMVQDLYKGIEMACTDYQCQLSGGDVTGSHNALVISVTAFGEVSHDQIVYNHGARKDDAICVTGDLGSAVAGLKILLREKRHWQESDDPVMQPDLTAWDYIVKKQLVPVARKDVIDIFDKLKIIPSSMIDISQGLLHELKRIVEYSETGAYIYQAALPVDLQTRQAANEMKEDVDKLALYGGEDFELLFTLSESQVSKLADQFKNFSVIGKITSKTGDIEMQTAEGQVLTFEK